MVDFFELLAVAKWLLRQQQRISYRALQRELGIDDELIENLRFELIEAQKVAIDEDAKVLVWVGNVGSEPVPEASGSQLAPIQARPAPISLAPSGAESWATVPPESSEAERRQLTVMFCDLVGSTALSTQMDPEDLRDVITSFQNRCCEAIKRYDGFIARYMGDGLLVYFGYPQAHEEDAERAARAGLDIVGEMATLNADVGKRHEVALAVRVGIATGPVIVGDFIGEGAAEEAAVVGETPNLAARLQGVAQPNQVVVGASTRRMLGELFELEDLGTHELKGITESVQIWQVLSERDVESRYAATRTGRSMPLVGRHEEIGLLSRAWEGCCDGRGQVVLIQGEAGVGKSRLLEALREKAGRDYTWVAIRSSPYHIGSAFYPIIKHLNRVLGWQPEDTTEEKLAKLESVLGRYQTLPLTESVPLFAGLMSLVLPEERYAPQPMTARQEREATLDALVGWLTEEADRAPVLMAWEDVHWMDPTTREILGMLINQVPTVPMLVVATYRPELMPPWPQRSHMTPIALNRLERPDVETMVTNMAGGKVLPSQVVEHIVSKADGVALYVEELTKTILDSALLEERGEAYVLNGSLAELEIPETLQDSLMARLDRAPALREVAQIGAVLGREFAYEMLRHLARLEEAALQDALEQLVSGELLYQRGRPPRARYIFKHALIQDAAYQSLLKRTRQQYHAGVALLLEESHAESVTAHPELVAHHLALGGEGERAIAYWEKAGQLAAGRSAYGEAVLHFKAAIDLLESLSESSERTSKMLDLQVHLAGALMVSEGQGSVEVAAAYDRAHELCEASGNSPRLVPVMFGLWRRSIAGGTGAQTRSLGERLLSMAARSQEPSHDVAARYAMGYTLLRAGDPGSALEHLNIALACLRPEMRHSALFQYGQDPEANCRAYIAMAQWLVGCCDQAARHAQEAVAVARELNDPYTLSCVLGVSGRIFLLRGDVELASQLLDDGIETAQRHGFPQFKAICEGLHGSALIIQDEFEAGCAQLHKGIESLRAQGCANHQPMLLSLLANAYIPNGRPGEAETALAEALHIADAAGDCWWQAETYRVQGDLALSRGVISHAESCFLQSLEKARQHGATVWELRAAMSLARLLRTTTRATEGQALLTAVHGEFAEGFDTKDLRDARQLLDEFQTVESDAAAN